MAHHAQKIRPCTAAEIMPLMRLAAGDDVQGVGLDNILQGCVCFVLVDSGSQFGYALIRRGAELWIQAAAGAGDMDLTRLGLDAIERQGAGLYQSVGFQTRRRGLVRKAQKQGYVVDGWILRKKI